MTFSITMRVSSDTPYQPETQATADIGRGLTARMIWVEGNSNDDMGRGIIARMIWKISCINR